MAVYTISLMYMQNFPNKLLRYDRTFAMLGIRGDDLNPAEVTALLGIVPNHAFADGETYYARGQDGLLHEQHHSSGVWALVSPEACTSDNLLVHAHLIVDPVYAVSQKWIELVERGYFPHFRVNQFSTIYENGFTLDERLILQLAELRSGVSSVFFEKKDTYP